MNTVKIIIDALFVLYLVSFMARLFIVIEQAKKAGCIKKVKYCLSTRKEHDSIKIFEEVERLMYITSNILVIFGWAYMNFMM